MIYLVSNEKNEAIPDEYNYFGQFVGEWDFDWVDSHGTDRERHVRGEWIFAWVLEGRAIQDIFICPSRAERLINPQPDGEYGTTIRIYNAKKQVWDVFYGFPGEATVLEARRQGENIELTYVNKVHENIQMKWIFSEITPNSFHWSNVKSQDDGNTWALQGELFAVRRK